MTVAFGWLGAPEAFGFGWYRTPTLVADYLHDTGFSRRFEGGAGLHVGGALGERGAPGTGTPGIVGSVPGFGCAACKGSPMV